MLLRQIIGETHHCEEKSWEALIRFSDGDTGKVTVEAEDAFDAEDRIKNEYCDGEDCIIEGPWPEEDDDE